MIRSSLIAAAGMAVLGFCEVAHGQSSINRFDEIAGSWTGHASSHRVTLEIDTSALPTANLWRDSIAQSAGVANIEELIRRRPASPNEAAVRNAQARLDRARAALENAQNNSVAEDWIYYGNGHRGPRPEYAARLDSLDAELKAAQEQLADEERRARLGS